MNPRESGKNQPKDVARLVRKMSGDAITITELNSNAAHVSLQNVSQNEPPTKEELIQIALLHRRFTCGRTPRLLSDRAALVVQKALVRSPRKERFS